MILVDTSIWSLALRRQPAVLSAEQRDLVDEWAGLVAEGVVTLIGPIRDSSIRGLPGASPDPGGLPASTH